MQSISRGESFGAKLGSGLGELAGYKIGQLLKKHQQEQERSQFTKTWEPILGKHSANFLSNLSPDERKNAMQDIGSLLQLNEPPSSADQTRGMQSFGMAPQQQMPDQQQNFLQGIQNRFTNQTVGQRPQEQEGSLLSGLMGAPQQYQQQPQPQEQAQQQQQQLTPERAKLIENLFKTPQQRAAEKKLEIENQRFLAQEKRESYKATAATRKEILDQASNAKDSLARLDKMEKLNKHGDFNSPYYIAGLQKFGLGNVAALMTPDSQEFRKLEIDFLRNLKSIFGSRITEYEVKLYLQSIPSLMQSKEGRERVIENLKIMEQGKLLKEKALLDIRKENKGNYPYDLSEQIAERIEPEAEKLRNKFRGNEQGAMKNTFNDLPPAAQFQGKKIRDKESGKILQSNGQEWLPVE